MSLWLSGIESQIYIVLNYSQHLEETEATPLNPNRIKLNKGAVYVGECVTAVELQRYPDLPGSQVILRATVGQLSPGEKVP